MDSIDKREAENIIRSLASRVESSSGVPTAEESAPPKEARPIPAAMFPGLVEIVNKDGHTAFLLLDRECVTQYGYNGQLLMPHPDYVKLFGAPIKADSVLSWRVDAAALLEDVEAFINAHTELPEELPALLVAVHIFQSYLQEKMEVLPYLYLSGPYGSGKSRVLETIAALAYRSLFTAGLTPAAIYRTCEMWSPTLLIDEFGAGKGAEDLTAVLNARYRRGLAVVRCRPKSFETETFSVFGPSVIAGPAISRSLSTRALSAVMAKSTRLLPRRIDQTMARKIRARLLAFRLEYYNAPVPEAPALADGRLDELISALHSILLMVDPTRDGEFRNAIAGQARRHHADESATLDAELAEVLYSLDPDTDGRVAVLDVVNALGWDPEDRRSSTMAANLLRRNVGLERCPQRIQRGEKKLSAYIWDEDKVARFARRYAYMPDIGCQVVQNGLFQQVDGPGQPFGQPGFGGCPEAEVVQTDERTTSENGQPNDFEVVQENTPLEQEKRDTGQPGQPGQPIPDIEGSTYKQAWEIFVKAYIEWAENDFQGPAPERPPALVGSETP
jgi:hypothetical protein